MYPPDFNYERAESVEHAVTLISEHADEETELLAGGHSLIPTIKTGLANVDTIIDIGELDAIEGIEEDDDSTRIGAMTRYADIVSHDGLWENVTVIAEAAEEIGDIQVRNMGTIGGNVAHADPASDLPAAVLASNAQLVAQGPSGERQIDADDYFQMMYTTALESNEILTRVEVPHLGSTDAGAYVKKPSQSSGFAVIGVAAVLQTDGEKIESARVAVNGAMDHAVRLDTVEEAVVGEPLTEDAVESAAEHAGDSLDVNMMMSDNQASAKYRQSLLSDYTARAFNSALGRV